MEDIEDVLRFEKSFSASEPAVTSVKVDVGENNGKLG